MSLSRNIYRYVKVRTVDKLYNKYVNLDRINESYISFTFDDFPKSAAKVALPVLENYNVAATYYVTIDYENKERYTKRMFSLEELQAVFESGHEIGGHTYDHMDCGKESYWQVKKAMEMNKQKLYTLFPKIELNSFAYPKGQKNTASRKLVHQRFHTARTTTGGINHGKTNLNILKANKLYSKSVPLGTCFDLIEKNQQLNGWLIFYTHDVEANPSDFGCTPEYFSKVIEYALQSNSTILPVNSVYEIIKNRIGQ